MSLSPLVLVVDDDADILEAISDILLADGYRVLRARNGLEALDCVRTEWPAVILLDLMMPVMDGPSFAHALREGYGDHGIPVIVISADGNPARAEAVGAQGYLAKPFDVGTLLGRIASMTAGASPPPSA